MFNLLTHHRIMGQIGHPGLQKARMADICAGCGALGLEALSRGARHVTFVDQARSSLDLVKRNAAQLGTEDAHTILGNATQLPRVLEPFDTVMIDPPYGKALGKPILESLHAQDWLAPHSLIVLETGAREALALPEAFRLADSRTYGAASVHLITLQHNI
jgi:16S rRNA (guanine966-N2)-methyltransferase